MKRKVYKDLLAWKNNADDVKPLMILGARQVGKTYIIDEFCKNEYNNYILVNLFDRTDIVELYNLNLTFDQKFNRLKAIVDFDLDREDTILFIDEI